MVRQVLLIDVKRFDEARPNSSKTRMKNANTTRRRFLAGMGAAGLATAFYETPGVFAEALVTTPEQTEGPYYPPNLPLDTDNDLLIINNNITPAVGTVLYLSGTVFDSSGNPRPRCSS